MKRYVCIHGHFYQPPRENPWLEAIEVQDSAAPFHDWNSRIEAECYAPNAGARILDGSGRILKVVNNYERISFNFGPTLLAWMQIHAPETYEAILEADRRSVKRFHGHGSALAQPYNHMIMPLASERDRRTQVLWGLADFRRRFDRESAGMWLPETAVDTPTLETLAEHGVRFTVLAPHQAAEVRKPGESWRPVGDGGVDTGLPYEAVLPSGRRLALFFYDGPMARAVAFERLLDDGVGFSQRILEAARGGSSNRPWLCHIATDGETYGHHHRFGEMALAFALERIDGRDDVELTNYGSFLERCPPAHEVRIRERSSWSCSHGLGRWTEDCGCHSGSQAHGHQKWRRPLRDALDWLRAEVDPAFERAASEILRDPWAARDDYIDVVLDRSPASVTRFLDRHGRTSFDADKRRTALELLELQRHAMFMFTSCGWFFDDVSGLEAVQVLRYASRVLQLARTCLGLDLEARFMERLAAAEGNLAETPDGRAVYARHVQPSRVEPDKLGAHAAVRAVFDGTRERAWLHAWDVDHAGIRIQRAGAARLAVGEVRIRSRITEEEAVLGVAALHLGDHNLVVAARPRDESLESDVPRIEAAFARADLPEVLRRIEAGFQGHTFTLADLFADEQRTILARVLAATLDDADEVLHRLHRRNAPLVRYLADLRVPLPTSLRATAELALNADLRLAFRARPPDAARIREVLGEFRSIHMVPSQDMTGPEAQRWLDRLTRQFDRAPWDPEAIARLHEGVLLLADLPLEVDIESSVKRLHRLQRRVASGAWIPFEGHPREAAAWRESMVRLCDVLGFRLTLEDWTPPAPSR